MLLRANGAVTVNGNEASGYADSRVGKGGPYKVYFFAQFSQPIKSVRTWVGDTVRDAPDAEGKSSGAILTFDTAADPALLVRVGVSYTSAENARDNLRQENTGWDFAAVQQKASALWNGALGRIEIEGGTADERTVFYTALYHCFIHPNLLDDANGQYLGMDAKIHTVAAGHHQYQNIPAWDEHRSHSPLMAIIAPRESGDVVQSLVNYAQQDRERAAEGRRPAALGTGQPQLGRHGGRRGRHDHRHHLRVRRDRVRRQERVGKSWTGEPPNPGSPRTGPRCAAAWRNTLPKATCRIMPRSRWSIAPTILRSPDLPTPWADHEKAAAYLRRAQNWKNLFDPATGYIRPRTADGAWVENFSPRGGKGFIEGSAAQYFWLVNFNLRGLIEKLGGNEKAVERLDRFFTRTNDGMSSEFAYMGNEPDEEVPWVYDFACAPARTQAVVRRIQTELFTDQPGGLPGNDDAGSLSSWYVFSALGLYPEIPGVAGFAVGSPVFPLATLHLDNGKTIRIVGKNAALANPFVQSLKLNGQPHGGPWVAWSALAGGGVLEFELGDKPSEWGKDPAKAPPSFDAAP